MASEFNKSGGISVKNYSLSWIQKKCFFLYLEKESHYIQLYSVHMDVAMISLVLLSLTHVL